DRGAERMRFGGAAAGERLGEEIEDDRPLLQLVGEVELELLAPDRPGGGEIRRLLPHFESGGGRRGEQAGGGECEDKLAHAGLPRLRSNVSEPLTPAGSIVRG